MKKFMLMCMTLVMPSGFAAIVDFESVVNNSVNQSYSSLDTQGFNLAGQFHIIDDPTACDFGGCALGSGQYAGVVGPGIDMPIRLTAAGGAPFTVTSISASMLFSDSSAADAGGFPNGDRINVLGNRAGGGTVMSSFSLGPGFSMLSLSGFQNLSSVVFSASVAGGTNNASFAIDDITATTIPEPATMSLVAFSALLGFALRRRNRRT